MQQVLATYRSVEASVTNIKLESSRQDLAVRIGASQDNKDLSPQQKQIVDEVGITEEAVNKLREAQELAKQLQNYLDYLYGRGEKSNISLVPANENADVTIQGRSTNLAAEITVATYSEETLEIAANFDDAGNLTELSVSKTSISAEYIQASYILEDTQFYAELSV